MRLLWEDRAWDDWVGYTEQNSTPATAARAEPIAKVIEMVALTLMPMS